MTVPGDPSTTDAPTELIITEAPQDVGTQRVSWLMAICLILMAVFAGSLLILGVVRGFTEDVAVGWLVAAGGLLILSFIAAATTWAVERVERLMDAAESRAYARRQHETYLVHEGQREIQKQISESEHRTAERIGNMHANFIALLEEASARVDEEREAAYSDGRADAAISAASKRRADPTGTEGRRSRGAGTVYRLPNSGRQD